MTYTFPPKIAILVSLYNANMLDTSCDLYGDLTKLLISVEDLENFYLSLEELESESGADALRDSLEGWILSAEEDLDRQTSNFLAVHG